MEEHRLQLPYTSMDLYYSVDDSSPSPLSKEERSVRTGHEPLDTIFELRELEKKVIQKEKIFCTGFKCLPTEADKKAAIK